MSMTLSDIAQGPDGALTATRVRPIDFSGVGGCGEQAVRQLRLNAFSSDFPLRAHRCRKDGRRGIQVAMDRAEKRRKNPNHIVSSERPVQNGWNGACQLVVSVVFEGFPQDCCVGQVIQLPTCYTQLMPIFRRSY